MPIPIEFSPIIDPSEYVGRRSSGIKADVQDLLHSRSIAVSSAEWKTKARGLEQKISMGGPKVFLDTIQEVVTETFFPNTRGGLAGIEQQARTLVKSDEAVWRQLTDALVTLAEQPKDKSTIERAEAVFALLSTKFPKEENIKNLPLTAIMELRGSINYNKTLINATSQRFQLISRDHFQQNQVDTLVAKAATLIPDKFKTIVQGSPMKTLELHIVGTLGKVVKEMREQENVQQQQYDAYVHASPNEQKKIRAAFYQTEFDMLRIGDGMKPQEFSKKSPETIIETTITYLQQVKKLAPTDVYEKHKKMQTWYLFEPVPFDRNGLSQEVRVQYDAMHTTQQWLVKAILYPETLDGKQQALLRELATVVGNDALVEKLIGIIAQPLEMIEVKKPLEAAVLLDNRWMRQAERMRELGATPDMCLAVGTYGVVEQTRRIAMSLEKFLGTEGISDAVDAKVSSLMHTSPLFAEVRNQYLIQDSEMISFADRINKNIMQHAEEHVVDLTSSAQDILKETLQTQNRLPIIPGGIVEETIDFSRSRLTAIQELQINSLAASFIGDGPTNWVAFIALETNSAEPIIPALVTSDGILKILAPQTGMNQSLLACYEQLVARSMNVLLTKEVKIMEKESNDVATIPDTAETEIPLAPLPASEERPYRLPLTSVRYIISKGTTEELIVDETPKRTHRSPRRHFVHGKLVHVAGARNVEVTAALIETLSDDLEAATPAEKPAIQAKRDQVIVQFTQALHALRKSHKPGDNARTISNPLDPDETIILETFRKGHNRGTVTGEERVNLVQRFYRAGGTPLKELNAILTGFAQE